MAARYGSHSYPKGFNPVAGIKHRDRFVTMFSTKDGAISSSVSKDRAGTVDRAKALADALAAAGFEGTVEVTDDRTASSVADFTVG